MREARARHEAVFDDAAQEDTGGGWMVSYIDIMTLLVATFVLLLSVSARVDSNESEAVAVSAAMRLGIPLPEMAHVAPAVERPLVADVPVVENPAMNAPMSGVRVDPAAVVVALGVARQAPRPVQAPAVVQAPIIEPTAIQAATHFAEAVAVAAQEAVALPELDGVEVTHVAEGISLRVEDTLLFDSANAELIGTGQTLIDSLLAIIERYEGEVSVEGHSDSQSIRTERFPSNWELSSARATAVLRHLQRAGIDGSRLRAVGFADTRPLADNATPEGRARNRRVEVIVHLN
ncbi:OmpA family protein [Litchfieldella xinjiangensis]|uniref:OmpA family protein n=1 Tax=Litchfieldella xinjiangensis TaxID=1166948 RepID=UPI0005B8C2D4|nr:OmpA family protein [Halomonas xinjiangensis]